MTEREQLAWAAGFMDGEGHISARIDDGQIRVFISQVHREPLDRFQKIVGVGRVSGPTVRPHPEWNDIYQYSATSFEDVQHIVASLWQFLSGPKRAQAADALLAWKRRPSRLNPHAEVAKLSRNDKAAIRSAYAGGAISQRELANQYDVSQSYIGKVVNA